MQDPQFKPPRWALAFFRTICRDDFLEEIEGDLMEIYKSRAEKTPGFVLKWLYVWEIIRLIRPKLLKSFVPVPLNSFDMFHDHFKVSVRNLNKYKGYTSINVFGLSVGMAAAILLFLVVRYEHSFDRFHSNYQRTYRVGEKEGGRESYYQTRIPLAPKLKSDIPEVLKATRMIRWSDAWVETSSARAQANLTCVDADFADIFDFQILEGDLKAALSKKDHLVISKGIATLLFGYEPAVGKEIREVHNEKSWIVGAVLKDAPSNSTVKFEMLTGWLSIPEAVRLREEDNWYNTLVTVYVTLENSASPESIGNKLERIVQQNFLPANEMYNRSLVLLPLAEQRGVQADNTSFIYLLGIVAVLILGMASVNFVNMSMAQSIIRRKEVAIRRVIGSSRWQLVSQFLVQAFIINLLASVVALLLVYVALPFLQSRFSILLDYSISDGLMTGAATFGFAALLGLLSGIFPAVYITSISTSSGIRGTNFVRKGDSSFAHVLLVFQFATSIFLIVATTVVWQQINYMKTQRLHFDAGQVIAVPVPGSNFTNGDRARRQLKLLAESYRNHPEIEDVSFGVSIPGRYLINYNNFFDYSNPELKGHLRMATVSSGYFETLGVPLLEGRTYDRLLASDSNAVVINKKAMDHFGWSTIEGKVLCSGKEAGCKPYKVIGVTKNFHYQSLEGPIEPTIHFFYDNYFNFMLVRAAPGKIQEALKLLENDWGSLGALTGLSYTFLEDDFAEMYAEQERIGLSAGFFTVISMIIALLGLLSVASFMIRRRRSEISIRKVLGASVTQLAGLLSKAYLLLVTVSVMVAVPAAWWLMDSFLEEFAYRIPISGSVFLFAGSLVLVFAGISVSILVIRAANENPVVALRNE